MEHDSDKEGWYLEDIQASATGDEASGWYINKNSDLDFLYEHVSAPSPDTNTCKDGSPRSSLEALKPLHVPVMSSLMTDKPVEDIRGAFFEVPPRRKNQKPLYFGRCGGNAWQHVSQEYETYMPKFSRYHPKAQRMMQRWGYDFEEKPGLNYGKGVRALPLPFVPEGKEANYYQEAKRGLGYTSPPLRLSHGPICFEIVSRDYSSSTSSWESDVSIGGLFEGLSINMVSASPLEDLEDMECDDSLLEDDDDPWIHHLNTLWDIRFEQREPPTDDKLVQRDLGDGVTPKPIFVGEALSPGEREDHIKLIREYIDVFAWNYEDMPGLDPQVATHQLNINPEKKPFKLPQRRFRPVIMEAIEAEVKKLINSGFIREEQHPDWVANIVPVAKKTGKIRICIDFRNLNDACPKDEFPLPITDVMIDNTWGFERMSFMDGFSGYNQITMFPADEKHPSFRTPLGMYCYTVMPFDLKNAGATYQRAMDKIFYPYIRKTVECYVNDNAVKSRLDINHLADLKEVFDIMRQYQLKNKPNQVLPGGGYWKVSWIRHQL